IRIHMRLRESTCYLYNHRHYDSETDRLWECTWCLVQNGSIECLFFCAERESVCVCVCVRSEEHTSELQSHLNLVCRLLLEIKNCDCECVRVCRSVGRCLSLLLAHHVP